MEYRSETYTLSSCRRNFLLCLFICTIAIAGCDSPEERVSNYLASAEQLFEEKDLVKAELEVKNALQVQPKNAQANFLLARISESRQDFPQMAASLRAAIESDPGFVEARVKLGTLYALGGATELAQEQVDALAESGVNTPDVKVLRARMFAVNGDLEASRVELEAALAEDPSNIQALGLLASIAATKDLDSALKLIDQGIATTENSRPLRLLRLQLLSRAERIEEVEADYKALISDYPDEPAFGYQYARFLVEQGRSDDVEKVLRGIIDQQPDDPQPRLALTQYVAGTRGSQAAEDLLREFVAAKPDMLDLRNTLARFYQANNRLDDAFAEYETVADQAGNDDIGLTARARMAGIFMMRGENENGEELLDDVLKTDSMNTEALILRGALYTQQEEFRDAVADFRNALRKDPENRRAQLLLAQTHVRAGDPLLAKDAYRRVLDTDPNNAVATLELAKLLVADRDLDDAEELLDNRLARVPQDGRAARALVALLQSDGRSDEAQDRARKFAAVEGQQAVGQYLLGSLHLAEKEYDEAAEAFKLSIAAAPMTREPLQGLVAALVRAEKAGEAKAFLTDFSAKYPDNLPAKTLLGQVLAGEGDAGAAAAVLEATLESDESWLPAYTALAGLPGTDVASQIDIYQRGLEAVPGSQELALLLGTALERNGRIEEAITTYQNALESNPDLPAVANNLAALLADHRTDSASLERALALSVQFEDSKNPAFVDTLGWVYYRLGELDKAIPLLEEAVEGAGQVPVLRYHLGMAYLANGQNDLARDQLQQVIDSDSQDFTGYSEAKEAFQKLAGN